MDDVQETYTLTNEEFELVTGHKFKIGDHVSYLNGKHDTIWGGLVIREALDSEYGEYRATSAMGDIGVFWEEDLTLVEPNGEPYDTVSKPEHYNHGEGIECIEYIKQVLGAEGFIAYCRGNLMKYNHRAMYKGKPVEDLEKAEQYLRWSIETLKETEGTEND